MSALFVVNLLILGAYVFYLILLGLVIFTELFIIQPWNALQKIKAKHKEQVYIYFYPLYGAYRLPYTRRQIVMANPKCRAIVSTHWRYLNFTLLSAEGIKDLTVNNLECYVKYVPIFMIQEIEKSLLLTEGLKWKHQKQMIRILNFDTIKNFTLKVVVNSISEILALYQKEQCQDYIQYKVCEVTKLGRRIQNKIAIQQFFCDNVYTKKLEGNKLIIDQISQYVEDIFVYSFSSQFYMVKSMVFGQRINEWRWLHNQTERELYKKGKNIKKVLRESVLERQQQLLIEPEKANQYNLMDSLIMEYIKQQKIGAEELKKLPNHKVLDIEEVVDQAMGMYIAALDNAGVFLGNIMFCLARYEKSCKAVQEEVEEIFGNSQQSETAQKGVMNSQELIDKLNKLEKTTLFIKECFRLYNSSPGMFPRQAIQKNVIHDIEIPENALVQVSWNMVTLNHQVYPFPFVFDIRRFESPGIQSSALTPFSQGRRSCIGENMSMFEIKILIVMFLQQFDFIKNDDVQPNMQQMGLTVNPVDDRLMFIRPKIQQNNYISKIID